jgi:sulfate transport system ATP-binding protein
MSITIENIGKKFGAFSALRDVNLVIPTGSLTALLGPSGSGKTTLLRIIAGLEKPDAGAIYFHGENSTARHTRERQVGFVFQHYALFKHMSIFENVAFGLRVRPTSSRPKRAEIRERVMALLKLVQLDFLADRKPSQLSGGQRQRVALARALAVEPKVLLLDEPFGALDAQVRLELRRWLRRLHDELHITSVLVTHDQDEAMEVADQVVVLNEGKVEQIGSPDQIYNEPATPFVYQFIGAVNLFHGRVHQGKAILRDAEFEAPEHTDAQDQAAVAYVRPHDIVLSRESEGGNTFAAKVRNIAAIGPMVRVMLSYDDPPSTFEAQITSDAFKDLNLQVGDRVYVTPKRLKVFVTG